MDHGYRLGKITDEWFTKDLQRIEIRHYDDGRVFVILDGTEHEIQRGHAVTGDVIRGSGTDWLTTLLAVAALVVSAIVLGLVIIG